MRTTVTIDDAQLATAREMSGITETSALVRAALKMLIEWEASRRLAALGGTDPTATAGPRKRPWTDEQA